MTAFALAATILVSAAASLTDVLAEIGKRYEAHTGARVQVNAGASNTLARQIVEGAPVDVFISADEAQMDLVEHAGRLVQGSRVPLLGNRLVVIVPSTSAIAIGHPGDLANPAIRRIAVANPQGVPAGVYARRWLEQVALWRSIQSTIVPLPTVRAVVAAVRERRADVGIVYATDARADAAVRVAFEPAADEVPRIVYPAAAVRGPRQREAAKFLEFLRSVEARAVFERAGFTTVGER